MGSKTKQVKGAWSLAVSRAGHIAPQCGSRRCHIGGRNLSHGIAEDVRGEKISRKNPLFSDIRHGVGNE